MNQSKQKIKICGITNLKDAKLAIELGATAIGFIFYKKSPRNIPIHTAKAISDQIPKDIIKVGVFVNESTKIIKSIITSCNLNMIQLHGTESIEDCKQYDIPVIKAFHVNTIDDINRIIDYKPNIDYVLLDTKSKTSYGGTGKIFNWDIANIAKQHNIPIFLSGGITPSNINEAINKVNPDFIDLSSSIEVSPGIKDSKKITKLFKALNKEFN